MIHLLDDNMLIALRAPALADTNQGQFATFDAGLDASLIVGGPAAYQIISAK